ncbi:MAG: response regulator [Gemmatimonas sp.]|nr:response regulator [Gemmatimonas sp.]
MGGTVLIVDPNDELRRRLGDLLEMHGFLVLEAADGITAWSVACNHKPDLITVRDPAEVYGARALLDSIRANVAMEDLPVLILERAGGHPEEWQERNAVVQQLELGAGPDEYVRVVEGLLAPVGPDDPDTSSTKLTM